MAETLPFNKEYAAIVAADHFDTDAPTAKMIIEVINEEFDKIDKIISDAIEEIKEEAEADNRTLDPDWLAEDNQKLMVEKLTAYFYDFDLDDDSIATLKQGRYEYLIGTHEALEEAAKEHAEEAMTEQISEGDRDFLKGLVERWLRGEDKDQYLEENADIDALSYNGNHYEVSINGQTWVWLRSS